MKKLKSGGNKVRGLIKRMAIEDVANAAGKLKEAVDLFVPDSLTQRQAMEMFMPDLYILRHKGYSFAQMTALLGDCGFILQLSSVRLYYNRFLAEHEDKYKIHLEKHLRSSAESDNQEGLDQEDAHHAGFI